MLDTTRPSWYNERKKEGSAVPDIPYAITHYARQRLIRKTVTVSLLTLGLLLLFILFGRDILGDAIPPVPYFIVSAVIVLLPMLLFRLPQLLLDRSFTGEVTKLRVKTSLKPTGRGGIRIDRATRLPTHGNISRQYWVVRSYSLTVRTAEGKRRHIPITSEAAAKSFRVGDTVGHVRGTSGAYLIAGKDSALRPRPCLICTTMGNPDATECSYCGMPCVTVKKED